MTLIICEIWLAKVEFCYTVTKVIIFSETQKGAKVQIAKMSYFWLQMLAILVSNSGFGLKNRKEIALNAML